jgi:hypothetical protein
MRSMATDCRGHGHNISPFQLPVGKHHCRERDFLVIFDVARALLYVS